MANVDHYSRLKCHEYALNEFNSKKMATAYWEKYEKVISGEKLNPAPPKLLMLQEQKFLDWK
jgi:hypothetical protein